MILRLAVWWQTRPFIFRAIISTLALWIAFASIGAILVLTNNT